MSQLVTLPGQIQDPLMVSFTQTNGTQAKVVQDVTAATGSLQGGCRVYDLVASSTDSSSNSVILWQAVQKSLYANMGTVTITGTNTINRTSGSFVTDGYAVGDEIMILGDTVTTANNGVAAVVTSVAAGALGVNGTPFTNETAAAGFRIVKTTRRSTTTVAANAGNNTSTANTQLLATANDSTKDSLGISLGANGLLLVSMASQVVGAVPARVTITGNAYLY